MAAFTYLETHKIIGILDNGKKLVESAITVLDSATGATPITIKSLTHIEAWNFYLVDGQTAIGTTFTASLGSDTSYLSGTNVIYITPSADGTDDRIRILSVGV